jgi:hypothetical protein
MTFATNRHIAASAVELRDEDGQAVATIYAGRTGVEIVCQQGYTAESSYDRQALITHLTITLTADKEARRR